MSKLIYSVKSSSLETNHIAVNELLSFYSYANKFSYTSVTLDISGSNHIDANLSALILAISYKLKQDKKVRVFVEIGDNHGVFFRNGLIAHLQGKGNDNPYIDNRESTIPLTTYNTVDDNLYCKYLRNDFFSHRVQIPVKLTT